MLDEGIVIHGFMVGEDKLTTRRALGGAHLPPTKVFRRLTGSVNKTMLKALLAAAANRPTYTSDFPDVKFRVAALK